MGRRPRLPAGLPEHLYFDLALFSDLHTENFLIANNSLVLLFMCRLGDHSSSRCLACAGQLSWPVDAHEHRAYPLGIFIEHIHWTYPLDLSTEHLRSNEPSKVYSANSPAVHQHLPVERRGLFAEIAFSAVPRRSPNSPNWWPEHRPPVRTSDRT